MAKNILGFPWDSFTLLQEDIAPSYNWIRGQPCRRDRWDHLKSQPSPSNEDTKPSEFTSETHTIQVWYFYLQLVVVKGKIMVNVGKYTIHGWYGKRMENDSLIFRVLLLAVRIRFQWG